MLCMINNMQRGELWTPWKFRGNVGGGGGGGGRRRRKRVLGREEENKREEEELKKINKREGKGVQG